MSDNLDTQTTKCVGWAWCKCPKCEAGRQDAARRYARMAGRRGWEDFR